MCFHHLKGWEGSTCLILAMNSKTSLVPRPLTPGTHCLYIRKVFCNIFHEKLCVLTFFICGRLYECRIFFEIDSSPGSGNLRLWDTVTLFWSRILQQTRSLYFMHALNFTAITAVLVAWLWQSRRLYYWLTVRIRIVYWLWCYLPAGQRTILPYTSQMNYHRGGEPKRAMHCWLNVMAHKPWIAADPWAW